MVEAADAQPEGVFSMRELAEVLGRRLDLTVGRQRLELLFEDGRLVESHTHSRVGSKAFEQLLVDLSPTCRRRDD